MKRNLYIFANPEKITTAQSFKKIFNKNFNLFFYDRKKKINFKDNDLVLHFDPCNFLNFNVLDFSAIKAIYLIDTHRDYKSRKIISKLFDIIFVAQYDDFKKLKKLNKNTIWLPLAFDSKIKLKKNYKRIYDVGFVGKLNFKDIKAKKRSEVINSILNIYKHNPQKFYSTKECYKIYKQSKMVINKSIDNDLNMRIFEAMGNGSVLVTDKITNKMNFLFRKNYHYLEYKNLEDCIKIFKKYLNPHNQKKLHIISTRAKNIILKYHTYEKRLNFMVKIMVSLKIHKKNSMNELINSEIFFHYHYPDLNFFIKNLFKKIYNRNFKFFYYFLLTIVKVNVRKYVK